MDFYAKEITEYAHIYANKISVACKNMQKKNLYFMLTKTIKISVYICLKMYINYIFCLITNKCIFNNKKKRVADVKDQG